MNSSVRKEKFQKGIKMDKQDKIFWGKFQELQDDLIEKERLSKKIKKENISKKGLARRFVNKEFKLTAADMITFITFDSDATIGWSGKELDDKLKEVERLLWKYKIESSDLDFPSFITGGADYNAEFIRELDDVLPIESFGIELRMEKK